MASPSEVPSITVFGEYFPNDQLTVASFVWPEENSADTYTIAPNTGLSLVLDRHFPIRLASIALHNHAPEQSVDLIGRLTSPELGQYMADAPRVGQFVLNLGISLHNRLLLAEIQAVDASTPPSVRRAVLSMLAANEAPKKVVA